MLVYEVLPGVSGFAVQRCGEGPEEARLSHQPVGLLEALPLQLSLASNVNFVAFIQADSVWTVLLLP